MKNISNNKRVYSSKIVNENISVWVEITRLRCQGYGTNKFSTRSHS